ncbi:MAG: hypothetical protein J2P28_26310, partial [Actinobacteria bacterium]|nr:hypothetical protein [Actinomycetota bacterium]
QGTMRLVLVAEEITDTLQAVIEFLNQRMIDTDVFGVEICQYRADGAPTCYVPRLVGTPSTEEPAREVAAAEVEEVLAEAMPAEAAAPAAPEATVAAVPATPEEEELQDAVEEDEEEELQDDLSGDVPEEELQDSLDEEESEAVQLQNRLRSLAGDSGLECREGSGSFSVVDRVGIVAAINTTLSTVEFWLAPVYESNPFQVTQIKNDLARVAQKALSERYPSLSAHDALANWEVVVDVLDRLIEVRATATEDSSPTSGGFVGQMSPPPAPPPVPPAPPPAG